MYSKIGFDKCQIIICGCETLAKRCRLNQKKKFFPEMKINVFMIPEWFFTVKNPRKEKENKEI